MFGNMGNMVKQAQMLQERMQKIQEEIAVMECTGEAGAGLVKITLNGKHEARKIEIDPSLFKEEDKEMCEDLIAAAFNDASRRVEEKSREKMASVTAGIPLPPGMKLPF